jgi:hypothetical protein
VTAAALRRWVPVLVVGVLIGVIKAESIADPNVLWGIRDGREILSSGHLPHSDHWSWTVPGKKWTPNSWGWDVVLGGLHRIGGGAALAVLNIVVVVLLALGMALRAYRLDARPAAVVAALIIVGGPTLLPWINDRPQLISYLFVVLLVPAVGPALASSRRRFLLALGGLAVLQVVWVNLHFFAIAGPVLIAVAGVGHLLEQTRHAGADAVGIREQALRLLAAVLVALAACGATPYGPVVAAKTLAVRNDAVGLIVEWRPAGYATLSQVTGLLAIVAALAAGLHAYRARRWDVAAALGVLAVGCAIACRMAPVAVVVAIPELAAALSASLGRARVRVVSLGLGAALVLGGVGLTVADARSFAKLDPASTSPSLLARLPPGCQLVNDYPLGGAVILFRPDVPVAVDSRTDLYGRAAILANRDLVSGESGAIDRIEADRVTCVLIPSDAGLVDLLEDAGQWRVAGKDDRRTLLLRTDS